MKAIVFRGVDRFSVEDAPRPVIQEPTDALVRVTTTTICKSDLKILHGKYRGLGYPHSED